MNSFSTTTILHLSSLSNLHFVLLWGVIAAGSYMYLRFLVRLYGVFVSYNSIMHGPRERAYTYWHLVHGKEFPATAVEVTSLRRRIQFH